MTYEQALEWLIDNVPVEMFDDYRDWYDACRKEIQTDSLWQSASFNRMHENYWNNNKPQEESRELPEYERTQEPVIEEQTVITKRSDSNIVTEESTVYKLPPTGRAPDILKPFEPVIDMSGSTHEKPKRASILSRIKRFFRI